MTSLKEKLDVTANNNDFLSVLDFTDYIEGLITELRNSGQYTLSKNFETCLQLITTSANHDK